MEADQTAWLRHLVTVEKKSTQTARSYRYTTNRYIAWLRRNDLDFQSVAYTQILEFLQEAWGQAAPATTGNRMYALRSFHRWLKSTGRSSRNPARRLQAPEVEDPNIPPPTHQEIALVRQAFNVASIDGMMMRAAVSLIYGCGLRVGEFRAIQREDINLRSRTLYVRGKGRRNRNVPIPPGPATSDVMAWLNMRAIVDPDSSSPYLFPGGDAAGMVSRETIAKRLRDAAREVGLDPRAWHPHILRHAFGTHLVEGDVDEGDVQLLMGHSDIETTRRYTRTAHTQRLRVRVDQWHPWSVARGAGVELVDQATTRGRVWRCGRPASQTHPAAHTTQPPRTSPLAETQTRADR